MNGKQAKKLRQLYKRDLGKRADQQAKLVDAQLKEYTEKLDVILKPAPKWIPEFIWLSLQRIFLNI
jgi:hypothetical protein